MDTNDPLGAIAKDHFNIDYLFPYQRLVISNILEAAGAEGFVRKFEKNPIKIFDQSRAVGLAGLGGIGVVIQNLNNQLDKQEIQENEFF